jgi:hypothetical protein
VISLRKPSVLAYNAHRRAVGGHHLRPDGTDPPADLDQLYHGTRGRLSVGQLPPHCTPASDLLGLTPNNLAVIRRAIESAGVKLMFESSGKPTGIAINDPGASV